MTDLMHTLLTLTLTGTALGLALTLLRHFAGDRLPRALHYYLWLLVLLRLALPWSLPGSGVDIPQPQLPLPIQVTLPLDIDPEGIQIIQGDPISVPEGMEKYAVAAGAVSEPWYTTAWRWVCDHFLYLWLGGAAIHFLWFVLCYLRYSRSLKQAATPLEEGEQTLLDGLKAGKAVRACRSPLTRTPMVVGLFRPRIVLPEGRLTDMQLEHILRHELTHVRRRDLWFKWAAVAVTSLHWFNPAMMWVRREIARCCELACDEAVIRGMSADQARAYGETLLALAAGRSLPRAVTATTLCEEKKRLKERLSAILSFKQATAAVLALCCALAVLFTGCAGILGAADRWEKRIIDRPGYQGAEWVIVDEDYMTALTDEEVEKAVALIDWWQRQNLPDLPERKLILTNYSEKTGEYVEFSNDQLYLDVQSGEIAPCTGPLEHSYDCGYGVLYGSKEGQITELYLIYLTFGGKIADREAGLEHGLQQLDMASQAYYDHPVTRYSWWMVDGTPIHARLYAHDGACMQKAIYNGGSGIRSYWMGEEPRSSAANLPGRYVYGLTRAIVDWQKEYDPVNADSYQLLYSTADQNKYFLSSPQDYAEFLGVAQYSLSTGQMTVLEAPTPEDAPYGNITLLYPAQSDTWLYLIGE